MTKQILRHKIIHPLRPRDTALRPCSAKWSILITKAASHPKFFVVRECPLPHTSYPFQPPQRWTLDNKPAATKNIALALTHLTKPHSSLYAPLQHAMRLLTFTVCSSFLSSFLCNFYLFSIFNVRNRFFLEAFPACVPQVPVSAECTPCDIQVPGFILLQHSAHCFAHLTCLFTAPFSEGYFLPPRSRPSAQGQAHEQTLWSD